MKQIDDAADISPSSSSEMVLEVLADWELEQVGGGAFPFIQQ